MAPVVITYFVSFILHSFLYIGVRDLVCRIDMWHKLSPPFVLQFHSVRDSSQFVSEYFLKDPVSETSCFTFI
jgi:hypothetical protein